jgi:hypothetical protein
VADFARRVADAVDEPPAENQPAADAGRDRHVDHVLRAASRAVLVLGERGGVGVVVEFDGHAGPLSNQTHDGELVPAGEVRRREDQAAAAAERPAATDPDRRDARAAFGDHLLQLAERLFQYAVRPAPDLSGEAPEGRCHPPCEIGKAEGDLRAADVHSGDDFIGHVKDWEPGQIETSYSPCMRFALTCQSTSRDEDE